MSAVTGGILCGTDFSPAADLAVDVATDFARRIDPSRIFTRARRWASDPAAWHMVAPPPRAVLANRSAGSARRRADEKPHANEAREIAAKLRALVPADAARLGVHTEVKVISDRQMGLAIAQTAERLGVDVVCFASRGRSGLSKLLLGSVAEEIIARVRRPVFVVRPPPC